MEKDLGTLFGLGIVAFIVLTSRIVNNVKKTELRKIQLWSEAIKKKVKLVRLTNEAFDQLALKRKKQVLVMGKSN